jgi:isoleucyl-tRNA synthetase
MCLGLILDEGGQKMSKSKGNIVVPWDVIDAYGADAFRWYFFTSKQPWDGYRFSTDAVGEGVRLFLKQLWNTYAFLQTYEPSEDAPGATARRPTWTAGCCRAWPGRWRRSPCAWRPTTRPRRAAPSRPSWTTCPTGTCRSTARRFWDGDPAAFATLRECLLTVAKLLAPFTPFVADEIYEGLDGAEGSVHLCDWPAAGLRDLRLRRTWRSAREAVRVGLAARGQSKVKLRQPLREAVVVAAGREREGIERHAALVRQELNVKDVRMVDGADELGSPELKPNYRALGPRFGRQMPQVAAAVEALDPVHVAAALRAGRTVGINLDGHEHELGTNDLALVLQPLEGYQVEREGAHAVALDLHVDEALHREGLAREIVRAVQNQRKEAGLEVSDRIRLWLGGEGALLAAAREHERYIAGEVLAVEVAFADGDGDGDGAALARIENMDLRISVTKV